MKDSEWSPETGNTEVWEHVFGVGAADLLDQRRFHSRLPGPPRCRLCKSPFGSFGGALMRIRGKGPSKRNPNFCAACDVFLEKNPGGANVPMSLLYADIRHSTEFARANAPADVTARINAFLEMATREIVEEDGFVVAFYGDCVVANWPPGFSGPDYIARAGRAGVAMAKASKSAGIPVGIGLHSGEAYIASVQANKGGFRDVSVFGEAVNVVARLSGAAASGEVIMTAEIAEALKMGEATEDLALKGFDTPVQVLRHQS